MAFPHCLCRPSSVAAFDFSIVHRPLSIVAFAFYFLFFLDKSIAIY